MELLRTHGTAPDDLVSRPLLLVAAQPGARGTGDVGDPAPPPVHVLEPAEPPVTVPLEPEYP